MEGFDRLCVPATRKGAMMAKWWLVIWWLRWITRDPGDALDARWCKMMRLPPREE
jgi:hypothetical protein